MSDRHRLFLACPLPIEVGEVIHAWAEECAKTVPMRVLPAEHLHVTIRFFGEVDAEGKADLVQLTRELDWKPLSCRLGGRSLFGKSALGFEINCGERALGRLQTELWPVQGRALERLPAEMQEELNSGVLRRMGAYVRDGERYSRHELQLHVTAARTKEKVVSFRDLPTMKQREFELAEAVLYESFLGEGGSRYEELARAGR